MFTTMQLAWFARRLAPWSKTSQGLGLFSRKSFRNQNKAKYERLGRGGLREWCNSKQRGDLYEQPLVDIARSKVDQGKKHPSLMRGYVCRAA